LAFRTPAQKPSTKLPDIKAQRPPSSYLQRPPPEERKQREERKGARRAERDDSRPPPVQPSFARESLGSRPLRPQQEDARRNP